MFAIVTNIINKSQTNKNLSAGNNTVLSLFIKHQNLHQNGFSAYA